MSSNTCANCNKGEENSRKLKSCAACKLVKYCSRDCQIAHRPQHKKECRRRAAELYDEKLFKQPPQLKEDCPICFLRMPSMDSGSTYYACCGKVICGGCGDAPVYDDQGNEVDNEKCAFCRTPNHETDEEYVKRIKKRVEVNDPVAIHNLGVYYSEGMYGFPLDHKKALEFWHRAVELGHTKAFVSIGYAYNNGEGVDVDKKKARHYYELAAIKGDAMARYNLGCFEKRIGNMDRATKHYMIAVEGGYSDSLKDIQNLYTNGQATKENT